LTFNYANGIVTAVKADELRKLRKGAGLTQAALAERLGLTPNAVARWEQQARSISEPMARLIRMVLEPKGVGR
jgi:transcriptional regulator with XRE-family HTH domain